MTPEHADLIARYIDGRATEPESIALQQALKDDANLRSSYLDCLNIDLSIAAAADAAALQQLEKASAELSRQEKLGDLCESSSIRASAISGRTFQSRDHSAPTPPFEDLPANTFSNWLTTLARGFLPAACAVLLALCATIWFFLRSSVPASRLAQMPEPAAQPDSGIALPASSASLVRWEGKILCATCAAHLAKSRFGVFLHDENGKQVVYHLRFPGPPVRTHETYCPQGIPGSALTVGIPAEEAGAKTIRVQTMTPVSSHPPS
jgi:hypothetical protein